MNLFSSKTKNQSSLKYNNFFIMDGAYCNSITLISGQRFESRYQPSTASSEKICEQIFVPRSTKYYFFFHHSDIGTGALSKSRPDSYKQISFFLLLIILIMKIIFILTLNFKIVLHIDNQCVQDPDPDYSARSGSDYMYILSGIITCFFDGVVFG